MQRRTLLTGAAALAAAPIAAPISAQAQAAKTKIVLWHALTGANGEEINRLAREFNASQGDYALEAVFKGSYPETLTATIAAWRAGQAPHLAQIYEVGTGSMLAAGKAVKQVWELAKETGLPLDALDEAHGHLAVQCAVENVRANRVPAQYDCSVQRPEGPRIFHDLHLPLAQDEWRADTVLFASYPQKGR